MAQVFEAIDITSASRVTTVGSHIRCALLICRYV
jgi:hypothetical protein